MVYPISPAREMFLPLHSDRICVQQTLLPDGTWIQQVLSPFPQGSSEPRAQWQMESHLGSLIQRFGNVSVEDPAKDVLPCLAAHLEVRRQSEGEFDDADEA